MMSWKGILTIVVHSVLMLRKAKERVSEGRNGGPWR